MNEERAQRLAIDGVTKMFDDTPAVNAAIVEAATVAAYFNFSNRLTSSLGVKPHIETFAAFRQRDRSKPSQEVRRGGGFDPKSAVPR